MIYLAHRGFWKHKEEQNSLLAFQRAFELGYGVETDIRDQGGVMVVSHDPPVGPALPLEELLALQARLAPGAWLALNLKAAELHGPLAQLLVQYPLRTYFLFDGAVPDLLKCQRAGLRTFARQSDLEPVPSLLPDSEGVFFDELLVPWIDAATVQTRLTQGKHACLVSPELHGRAPLAFWQMLRKLNGMEFPAHLMLCTDHPDQAEAVLRA